MSFQPGDYVVAAIPTTVVTIMNTAGFAILIPNPLGGPGHLRFCKVIAASDSLQIVLVYNNTAGHALIFLPYIHAIIIPQNMHPQAQQAINAQPGPLANLLQAAEDALLSSQRLEQFATLKEASDLSISWSRTVLALPAATTAVTGVTVFGGAAIMSNLAALGGIVGLGAVGGIAAVSAGPGLLVTHVVNAIEDDALVKTIIRFAGAVGTAIGVSTSVYYVAAGGTVGLSGAGITSGLCAVGSVVGAPTMVGGLLTCGAMTGGIAFAVILPTWFLARALVQALITARYNTFVTIFNGLGYIGPP